jgi:hypothetical protein
MPMSPRLLRPRASGFNPKSISGLALWLDATDSTSYTLATGVQEWRDKSGNGRNFSESVGNNQPLLTTWNGKTALSFDGTNDRLISTSSLLSGNGSLTVFQALQATFPGTASWTFDHKTASGGADTNDFNIGWRADQGASWIFGSLRTRVKSVRSGTQYNADQRFDSVDVSGRGVVTVSATFSATSASNTTWWNNSAAPNSSSTGEAGTVAGMAIGCRNNVTPDLFFTGIIGEVICYVGTITTTQRLAVQSYLAKKWGVTLA